jgi:hypothetical protein
MAPRASDLLVKPVRSLPEGRVVLGLQLALESVDRCDQRAIGVEAGGLHFRSRFRLSRYPELLRSAIVDGLTRPAGSLLLSTRQGIDLGAEVTRDDSESVP